MAQPTISSGTSSCSACDSNLGNNYLAIAATDSKGNFTLTGVPATTNVPVVVQTGKWRRTITIAGGIRSCENNVVPDKALRLPQSIKDAGQDRHCPRVAPRGTHRPAEGARILAVRPFGVCRGRGPAAPATAPATSTAGHVGA
jgi:hypothetical protein